MKFRLNWWYGLLLIPLLFLAAFYIYPLLSILDVSLRPNGELDLSGFAKIISSSFYRDTLFFTIWQAFLSTLFTLVLALPSAYIFTRYDFRGKGLMLSLSTLPFVLPTVVVAAAFSSLIGSRGIFNTFLMNMFNLQDAPIQLERTLAIILIVHVFYNYAIALRIIASYWSNQSTQMEEAARVLGCHGWRLWWEIRLPMLRPAILAAASLVFIFTFTSFGIILILGGIQYATLEVQIYTQALNIFNLPLAGALSLVQIGIMFVIMLAYTQLQSHMTTNLTSSRLVARKPKNWREWAVVNANLLFMFVLLFAPLAALVLRSVMVDGEFSFEYYQLLGVNTRGSITFVPPARAILNSVVIALVTMVLAVTLGVLSSYLITKSRAGFARIVDPLFMLPLATSAVTLGFGFIIALDEPPLNLRSSWVIIPIAHTLVAMPFVMRSVLPALRSIPKSIPESARVLGASPLRVWRWMELPLISRGLVVGATFAFTVSMGEFGASLFVARPDTPTMPVVIFRLLGQPGVNNYGQALAMSVILLLICAISFIAIERVRTAQIAEF